MINQIITALNIHLLSLLYFRCCAHCGNFPFGWNLMSGMTGIHKITFFLHSFIKRGGFIEDFFKLNSIYPI